MCENWRKIAILPSEQVELIQLLKKYGSSIVKEEIEHLIKKYRIPSMIEEKSGQ